MRKITHLLILLIFIFFSLDFSGPAGSDTDCSDQDCSDTTQDCSDYQDDKDPDDPDYTTNNDDNDPPTVYITTPIIHVGLNGTVNISATATDPENNVLSYEWRQISGLPHLNVFPIWGSSCSFTAPNIKTVLKIEVRVSDGENTEYASCSVFVGY